MVAFASAVTIDTTMGASAIDVDPVGRGKNSFVISVMHFHFIAVALLSNGILFPFVPLKKH
jgi:hypothetical protein